MGEHITLLVRTHSLAEPIHLLAREFLLRLYYLSVGLEQKRERDVDQLYPNILLRIVRVYMGLMSLWHFVLKSWSSFELSAVCFNVLVAL